MRRAFLIAGIAALFVGSWAVKSEAQTQPTPVGAFADIAGKWSGTSSRGTPTALEIAPDGKFKLTTTNGNDAGTARLEAGVLIVPTSDNQGQYKLARIGDALEGPVHWRGFNATVRLTRAK